MTAQRETGFYWVGRKDPNNRKWEVYFYDSDRDDWEAPGFDYAIMHGPNPDECVIFPERLLPPDESERQQQ